MSRATPGSARQAAGPARQPAPPSSRPRPAAPEPARLLRSPPGCSGARRRAHPPDPRSETMDSDAQTRARITEHWQASERGDSATEHAIYATDAILDYPQSGERFRSRATIAAQRGGHPADRHFTVLRISGCGEVWVSECIITYDGVPSYSVSIMEFADEHVIHESQYFAD